MPSTPQGFAGAPVTKALLIITLTSTCIYHRPVAGGVSNYGTTAASSIIHVSALLAQRRWWRLLASTACYPAIGQLSCGMYLTNAFRDLERQIGSAKFGAFLLLVHTISTGVVTALAVRFPSFKPATGPLAIMGALLTLYYACIPVTSRKPIILLGSGIKITWEKSLVYALGGYLLARNVGCLVPASCGALMAVLYMSNIIPLQKVQLPRLVRRFFGLFHPLLYSEDPRMKRRRQMLEMQRREGRRNHHHHPGQGGGRAENLLGGHGGGMGGRQGGAGGLHQRVVPAQQQIPPPPPPPEESIQALMMMGFDREESIAALKKTHNHVDAAANQLLGGNH